MSRYETSGGSCPLCGLAYGWGSHGIGFCIHPQPITSAPSGLTEADVRRIVREEIARFDRTGIHADAPTVQPSAVKCTCGEPLFHKMNCEAVQAQRAADNQDAP